MFLAIKSISGHNYDLDDKKISLKGGCYLNEITAKDFKALRDKYACIDEFIEKVNWFGDKKILEKVLNLGIQKQLLFKNEKIDEF